MADLGDLYQQIIIDHNRNPRNFRKLDDANRTAHGDNPLCGDKITLYLRLDGEVIADAGFQGSGCAISKASASLMTSAVKGKTATEAERLFHAFHAMVTADPLAPPDSGSLGKLAAFAGVRQFPARVKCANLSWHTLHAALEASPTPVTTDDRTTGPGAGG
ncbi:MAG: SUF system NifU family Fe-S cluster assembly protein [Gemmatimonadetes bacterium]|nr:SUF system NifU family Fe-S cluster assembly protein [Gemmatimonadota bacterium]